tara:strand:- start:1949 stop:2230 length:282 start_codon:yes stop_codon:yes gene_type:complete
MSNQWDANDWSNILTVGAAALCSVLMVLFKSRCSNIKVCFGLLSCDRQVKEDDEKKNITKNKDGKKQEDEETATSSEESARNTPNDDGDRIIN